MFGLHLEHISNQIKVHLNLETLCHLLILKTRSPYLKVTISVMSKNILGHYELFEGLFPTIMNNKQFQSTQEIRSLHKHPI